MDKFPSVLISGKSPDADELKAEILKRYPQFTAETAVSGKEAREMAKKADFDIFISFFSLPDMNGIKLFDTVRKIKEESVFILIYEDKDSESVLDALNRGNGFYIQKSEPPAVLHPEISGKIESIIVNKTKELPVCRPEEKTAAYFRESPDGIFVADSGGHFTDVNPSACRITGYSKEELLNMSIAGIHHPSSIEKGMEAFEKLKKTGHSSGEFLFTKKNGRSYYISIDAVRTGNDEYVGFCRDITHKKEADRELLKSHQKYKSLVENINDIVYSLDSKGIITYISPSIESVLGIEPKRIIKKHFSNFIHQDDIKEVTKHFKLQLKGISKPVTFRAVDSSGSIHYLRSSTHTIKDNNIVTGFTGIISDFTGEYLAREALLESEKRFRTFCENSPVAYQSFDEKGRFVDVNPEWTKITGYSGDEIRGRYFWDLYPKENTENDKRELFSLIEKGDFSTELTIKAKDGKEKIMLLRGRVQHDSEGKFVMAHCILHDITERRHAEEHSRLLASMSDNAPASIIVHDYEGNIIYANQEAFRLHGYLEDEFKKLNLYEINAPESREKLADRLIRIRKKGELDYDVVHIRKDGSEIPLHVNVKTIEWESKLVLLNIATDLTERKKDEMLLKEKNLFLQQLIDTIPNPIFYKDIKGRYLGCNTAFQERLGFLKDDIIGKNSSDLFPKELSDIYKAQDQKLFDNPGVQKYESTIIYADGIAHDVIFFKATYDDIEGNVSGLVGVVLDISERKKMEEALRESEAKFKSYVEYAKEAIYVVDPSGKLIDVNPAACEILGYPKDEILNLSISDLVPPEDIDYIMSGFNETIRKGHISDEIRTKRKDGRIVPVILNAVLMPDGNLLGIHTDITDLKNAEEGIKEANRKLNLLSSITRHDILNQLTGIIAFLEIIEMDGEIEKGSRTENYLKKISGAAQTIKRQILFTKDYKDMGEQAPRWQNLEAIVDETAKNSVFEDLTVEKSLDEIEIYADPLFEKVIYNLFDNALKHGEKTTKINFESIKQPEGLTIICSDDGLGVPEDFKDKIFNRQHYKNTGLGLFLSREILSITGISIKETGEYGKGARFEITVPEGKYRSQGQLAE